MKKIIETKNLRKEFHLGEVVIHALRGVNLTVEVGDFVAIMGASGSGKSTLMNLLGCLDEPTSGEYVLDGELVNDLSLDDRARIRNQKIGFVFQGFNLLARTSAIENVELPLTYNPQTRNSDLRTLAIEALHTVGLGDRMEHEPSQLSGGQQQRVAIARALVNKPSLILADEPTGNLDSVTSIDVMGLFQQLNDQGITIVLVTHEHDIARYTKRIVEVKDGLIKRDIRVVHRANAAEDIKKLRVEGANEAGIEAIVEVPAGIRRAERQEQKP
jgi:putative ABC transport system ATP-binding protein